MDASGALPPRSVSTGLSHRPQESLPALAATFGEAVGPGGRMRVSMPAMVRSQTATQANQPIANTASTPTDPSFLGADTALEKLLPSKLLIVAAELKQECEKSAYRHSKNKIS